MNKHELCCVGHITLDKVVTPAKTVYMPGGTSFYFSHAIKHFDDIDYALVTALGATEMQEVDRLRSEGIAVHALPSKASVYFENIYGANYEDRTQRVLAKADPFVPEHLRDIESEIYHLGSLLADDFSLEVVRYLSQKGKVSVDTQGYLREVRDQNVFAVDWPAKKEFLPYIHFLKANEMEMEVLTGYKDIAKAARQLADWGVKETLITLGSMGSVIYAGSELIRIPAYQPRELIDSTGCGDTYMTGYLYKRAKKASMEEAGHFAAAMSTLKLAHLGPFTGTKEDIKQCIQRSESRYPSF